MFKLVALFAAVAVAAANPAVVAPLAFRAGVLPYSAGVLPYSAGVLPYSAGVLPYSAGVMPYNYIAPYTYPFNYGVVPAVRAAAVATQAPGAPAIELDPINKVPLDTPEVAAAKIAHYDAKAFEAVGIPAVPLDTPEVAAAKISHLNAKALETVGIHTVKKRSIVAPVAYTGYPSIYSSAWVAPYSAYRAPVYAPAVSYASAYNTLNIHPY